MMQSQMFGAGLAQGIRKTWNGIDGNDRDLVVEGVLLVARVDHPKVFQGEILNGNVHGAARAGGIGVFKFKPVMFTRDPHQQVQFSAGQKRESDEKTGSVCGVRYIRRLSLPCRVHGGTVGA